MPRRAPWSSAVSEPRGERPDDMGPSARRDSSAPARGRWTADERRMVLRHELAQYAAPIGLSVSRRVSRVRSTGSIPARGGSRARCVATPNGRLTIA